MMNGIVTHESYKSVLEGTGQQTKMLSVISLA